MYLGILSSQCWQLGWLSHFLVAARHGFLISACFYKVHANACSIIETCQQWERSAHCQSMNSQPGCHQEMRSRSPGNSCHKNLNSESWLPPRNAALNLNSDTDARLICESETEGDNLYTRSLHVYVAQARLHWWQLHWIKIAPQVLMPWGNISQLAHIS